MTSDPTTAHSLPARVLAHIRQARLFSRPGKAIVAVSGGGDSVALLDVLHELAPELDLTLVVAHVDHGIALDSRTVGLSVKALAERYDLPFEGVELHLGPNASETEARRARYAWLRELQQRRSARYLVTAHHEDDQVETIVLRALRGSAPAGLAGIAARARGGLVRPLLPFTRAELVAYVAARGLAVYEDPANRDPRHLRSWIRTTLLPLLTERLGSRLRSDLLTKGRHAAGDRRAWDRVVDVVPDLGFSVEENGFAVARGSVGGYDNELSVALLRAAARRVGLVLGPSRAQRLVALARRPSGRRLPLGDGWWAEVAFDTLRVSRRDAGVQIDCALEHVWPTGERGSARFGEFEITWSPAAAPAQIERATWTTWLEGDGWEVRAAARGDALLPLGGVGHRPVRRLLMEARVPRSLRPRYPVVSRGETILWVPGICRSAEGVPGPGTRAVRVDVTEHGSAEADGRA
jgi:tRNA(Ile)-lysidine synthase